MTIDSTRLGAMLLTLLAEAYDGPEDPSMTWFADNEPGSGALGTLRGLSAAEASAPLPPGELSAATHAGHLRFALNLANRALRGEKVHASADWKASWAVRAVDQAAWESLLAELGREYHELRAAVEQGLPWADELSFTGIFGQLAHGAWHLGALRQGLGKIRVEA